jgi:NAD(P)-dependent dehydrogenase (short-subunit alcohol dehydrogenase family)
MRVAKSDVGGGSMVNAASIVGLVGKPKCSVYCASKHAVIGTVSCALRKLCRCFFGMPDPRWCVQSACNHQPCRPIPFLGSLCLSTSCSRSCFVLSLLFVKQCQSQCVARGFVDTPLMHAHDEKMGSKLPYEVVLGRRAKPEEVAK